MKNNLKHIKGALVHAYKEFFNYFESMRLADINDEFFRYLEESKDRVKFKWTRVYKTSFEINSKPYVIKNRIVYNGDKVNLYKIFDCIIDEINEESAEHFYLFGLQGVDYFIESNFDTIDQPKTKYSLRYTKDYKEEK